MTGRFAATAAAALAALAAVCACTSTSASTNDTPNGNAEDTTTAPSSDTQTTSSAEPMDLAQIPEDTRIEPGTYSVALLADSGPTRAIVEVPAGYSSAFGGTVIASHDGDMAFWGKVTKVDTDPCLGGRHVDAGTSVHDLASLLAAQRHMRTSKPVPVTVGGYHGVYLTLTAPADIQHCRGGSVTLYTAGSDWLQMDVPSATFHQWILNVDGQRVVAGARIIPDAANEAELIGMVKSAEFSVVGQS
jgi:hypothetical protein